MLGVLDRHSAGGGGRFKEGPGESPHRPVIIDDALGQLDAIYADYMAQQIVADAEAITAHAADVTRRAAGLMAQGTVDQPKR